METMTVIEKATTRKDVRNMIKGFKRVRKNHRKRSSGWWSLSAHIEELKEQLQ